MDLNTKGQMCNSQDAVGRESHISHSRSSKPSVKKTNKLAKQIQVLTILSNSRATQTLAHVNKQYILGIWSRHRHFLATDAAVTMMHVSGCLQECVYSISLPWFRPLMLLGSRVHNAIKTKQNHRAYCFQTILCMTMSTSHSLETPGTAM